VGDLPPLSAVDPLVRAPQVDHHAARIAQEDPEQLLQELGLGHGQQLGKNVPVDGRADALRPAGRAR